MIPLLWILDLRPFQHTPTQPDVGRLVGGFELNPQKLGEIESVGES